MHGKKIIDQKNSFKSSFRGGYCALVDSAAAWDVEILNWNAGLSPRHLLVTVPGKAANDGPNN